jgi:hypothetical protein
MLVGAPLIVGGLISINRVTAGKTKINLKIAKILEGLVRSAVIKYNYDY